EAEKKDDDELKLPPAEAIEIRLTLPRAQPQGSFVLKNARVVTMKGDAVLDDADVVVTGNRIAAVGPAGQVTVPAGAKSWDARGQVRRMKAYGARMIKVYQQPKRSQRIWFAEASRDQHMLLTAEGAGELNTDLTMALDGFTSFEHSLPVELQKDVVELLAKSGTYYTPTLIVSYGGPWGEQYFWQTMNPHDDPKLNRFVPHRSLDVLGRRHVWI